MIIKDTFEIIEANNAGDLTAYPCLVTLPAKSEYSDKFFSDKWNIPIIRPIVDKANIEKYGRCLNSKDFEFAKYVSKIKEVLQTKKEKGGDVVLIDLRVSDKISSDIVINSKDFIPDKLIEPVFFNILTMGYNLEKDTGTDLDLIRDVADVKKGIYSYQLIISEKLFSIEGYNGKSKGVTSFEEAVTFSYIALRDML